MNKYEHTEGVHQLISNNIRILFWCHSHAGIQQQSPERQTPQILGWDISPNLCTLQLVPVNIVSFRHCFGLLTQPVIKSSLNQPIPRQKGSTYPNWMLESQTWNKNIYLLINYFLIIYFQGNFSNLDPSNIVLLNEREIHLYYKYRCTADVIYV